MKSALLTHKDVKKFIFDAVCDITPNIVLSTQRDLRLYYGVTAERIRAWLKQGLPFTRINKRKWFSVNEVNKWLLKNNIYMDKIEEFL